MWDESFLEKENQLLLTDGMSLGTKQDMLVLERVTCGSSSRIMAMTCLCSVWEWTGALNEHHTCVLSEVVTIMYPSWEE